MINTKNLKPETDSQAAAGALGLLRKMHCAVGALVHLVRQKPVDLKQAKAVMENVVQVGETVAKFMAAHDGALTRFVEDNCPCEECREKRKPAINLNTFNDYFSE